MIQVVGADSASVTLRAEATVDRTEFGMTWSPLGMAAHQARGSSPAVSYAHDRLQHGQDKKQPYGVVFLVKGCEK